VDAPLTTAFQQFSECSITNKAMIHKAVRHVAGRNATADRCIFVPAPSVKNEETGNLAR
jgi:hypothetical protein